ncbi:alpha/beta hydrolase family protein [Arthrobacter rhombi]|uniref:alpha/beta hydrolase family protein n=1 Tax=Arthrobacter rhombi TaxID=71253 RepID=UPI003FD3BA97
MREYTRTADPATPQAPMMRWAVLGAGVGVAAGSLLAASASALAGYFARQVVLPVRKTEDLAILAVVRGDEGLEVILPATAETTDPGTYSLYFDAGRGHARIGEILSFTPAEGTIARRVERVYSGNLETAVRGWWSGAVYATPEDAGFAAESVDIPTAVGAAPAWLVPGTDRADTWAIMVHGRGAARTEGLRALSTTAGLGMSSLLLSYRNDGVAPFASDQRYGLGSTEWEDVEAGIDFALQNGAHNVILMGWSMGGAISLQVADKSRYKRHIQALVLDGPVVNWIDVLRHHAKVNRIPEAVGRLGQWMLSNRAGRTITGLAAPVDLKELNWIAKADQLRVPTLILHSEDDDFVPVGASAQLAELNPEMVTFERFTVAAHTREWNVDPERWEQVVTSWLARIIVAPKPGGGRRRR